MVSATVWIGSVPASVVAATAPSTHTSKPGMSPVARLYQSSSARTETSNGSPAAATLGANPCTPVAFAPTISKGCNGSMNQSPEPSMSTYRGIGTCSPETVVTRSPGPPPEVSP